MTDPFRPAAPPRFPGTRLTRAGLDEDTVARLQSEYDGLDYAGRVEFGRYIASHSDDAIRQRYAGGSTEQSAAEEPAAPAPTYEELNALTVDELDDRLREWNAEHPGQHLAIAGRKGEKIGRLLDAYDGQQEAAVQAPADAAPEEDTTAAEQTVPTAPTATTPEGAPQDAAVPHPIAPEGTQTADAAGAGTATTEE